jgi:hypothetical protein
VSRNNGRRDGRETNQKECETEENPREGKNVNRGLEPEERVPDEGGCKENTTEDV